MLPLQITSFSAPKKSLFKSVLQGVEVAELGVGLAQLHFRDAAASAVARGVAFQPSCSAHFNVRIIRCPSYKEASYADLRIGVASIHGTAAPTGLFEAALTEWKAGVPDVIL